MSDYISRSKQRLISKTVKNGECWDFIGARSKDGYGRILFEGENSLAHRVSYTLFNGEIEVGSYVLHSCDNPPCVNPKHLFLGTQHDNMADMFKKKRAANRKGESNGRSKLTKEKIQEAKNIRLTGCPYWKIAKKFGVSYGAIRMAIVGKSWRHLSKTKNTSVDL